MKRLWLYGQTLRHLQATQLVYLIWNRLRTRPKLTYRPAGELAERVQQYTFIFLNQTVAFTNYIDWNYAENGKLWTYHLNYFDFLNEENLTLETGLALIHDFIGQTKYLRDGLEPYPTSLRLVNWIQFLTRHQVQNADIEAHIVAQTRLLRQRLEYHLSGNHLLENALALLMSSIYCNQEKWRVEAEELLKKELADQVLSDGAQYERSPVYHQLLLWRLLRVYPYVKATDSQLTPFLAEKAAQMLGWLQAITFSNGNVPLVNDAALGMGPTTSTVLKRAVILGLDPVQTDLGESGYRMVRTPIMELFADVGAIGPAHQPGHAHADTLSFVLHVQGIPLIVDAGISTYKISLRRQWERSTAAHNTVTINDASSSAVWAGFRVGNRARVELLAESATSLLAQHDGYQRQFGLYHERLWQFVNDDTLLINDTLIGKGTVKGTARLYFHPDVAVHIHETGIDAGPIHIDFSHVDSTQIQVDTYQWANGFNCLLPAQVVSIGFRQTLQTRITVTP